MPGAGNKASTTLRWCLLAAATAIWTTVVVLLATGLVFSRMTGGGGGGGGGRGSGAVRVADRRLSRSLIPGAPPAAAQASATSTTAADTATAVARVAPDPHATPPRTYPIGRAATPDVDIPTCLRNTPECAAEAKVERRWGIDTGKYSQKDCCAYHAQFQQMMRDMKFFLSMQRVPYWVSDGALIGALRHGGNLVPWDLDTDFYVPASPNSQAMTAMHLTETHAKLSAWDAVMPDSPFVLRPCAMNKGSCFTSWKLHRRDQHFVDRLTVHGPKLDLMITLMDDQNMMRVANPYWIKRIAIPVELILPLGKCKIHGTWYSCPHDSAGYLRSMYGDSVLDKVESDHDCKLPSSYAKPFPSL